MESYGEKDSRKKEKGKGGSSGKGTGVQSSGGGSGAAGKREATDELSENELETQRALLLQQLKFAADQEDAE